MGGGGIYILDDSEANSTPVKILNSVIRDNTAPFGGGVLAVDATHLYVICCTISGNTATGVGGFSPVSGEGGGMRIQGPSEINTEMTVQNCLIVSNATTVVQGGGNSRGGGLAFIKGILGGGIVNCTFDGNSATVGGAYYQANIDDDQNDMTIDNSILWDNGSNEVHVEYGEVTIRESDINGGEAATSEGASGTVTYAASNINSDPLYTSGHHLQCSSPCVNNAENGFIPDDVHDVNEIPGDDSFATPDRDLNFRIVAEVADMGAYEAIGHCCLGDTNDSGAVNINDLLNVVNTWGNCTVNPCLGDIYPNPCPNGVVDINDLLEVINNWGNCDDQCPGIETVSGGIPQDYNDCNNACSEYTGQEWADCMQACFRILCENGQEEYCDD